VSDENSPALRIPISTYRLQFNRNFRFTDAKEIVQYLHELGIGDIYASPYFSAKKGSLHGYDIVDHNALNPEIGTKEEFEGLMAKLREYGMGQVLDIVPNHMGIGSENQWWMDLLENGPSSVFAGYFDVNWKPVKQELKDKVLLPALGVQYGAALENQEMSLSFHEGAFFITYYEHRFPVSPQTYTHILKQGLEILEDGLTTENPHVTELLSIITAIEHLPPYTEKDSDKIRESHREKEIIKKRLQTLYINSPEIRKFLDGNIMIFNGVKGEPRSFDLLDKLLGEQAYRLSHWRVAAEEINYRRFFDINDLAAIRVEDEDVFNRTHRLIMELVKEGKVTGLRVDHPDGLYDPEEYFRRLQRECFINMELGALTKTGQDVDPEEGAKLLDKYIQMVQEDPQFKPFYIMGEKILIKGERMPDDWPVFSTTGYAFMNAVNSIFIDAAAAKYFDKIYSRFIKTDMNYQDVVYEKKRLVMFVGMASEINTLAHYLNIISEKNRHTRDFTLYSLRRVIVEVIAFFPVYRTYINRDGVNDRDRKYIEAAVSKARRKNPAISEYVFEFLKSVLLLNYPDLSDDNDKKEWLDFVMRFQQITGPVMAIGVEDTAFYVYNRFVSLNEVGGSPDRFGASLDTFHGQNLERMKGRPYEFLTTSTHDTKRSEDVRARLNVLSEIPGEWRACLIRWGRMNRKKRALVDSEYVPDRNEEYLLYQTLAGAWPENRMSGDEHNAFKTRIREYMLKAVREAKVNTSWISPNVAYENALMMFIEGVMGPYPDSLFLKDFLQFQEKVSHYGMFNSLSQMLLKITSPGVPDFYQGTELWNFTLVDPDNRRPVDYAARMRLLEELKKQEAMRPLREIALELMQSKDNGMIKLYLIYKALNYRKDNREIFEKGEYIPLEIFGMLKDNVCAYARTEGDKTITVAVPRFLTRLAPMGTLPFGEGVWQDTCIVLPFEERETEYHNVLTAENVKSMIQAGKQALRLSEVFRSFPVALLEKAHGVE